MKEQIDFKLWFIVVVGLLLFGVVGALIAFITYVIVDGWNKRKESKNNFCKVCYKKITGEKAFHPKHGVHCMDCYNIKFNS